MNQSIMMGRLTKDPEIRYAQGDNSLAIANIRLAVDRPYRRDDEEQTADFFSCTAFGRLAEFADEHLRKGVKILVVGRLQNDNYKNRDGERVYGVRLILSQIEFAESKKANSDNQSEGEESGSSRNRRSGSKSNRSGGSSENRRSGGGNGRNSRSDDRRDYDSGRRSSSRRDPDDEFMRADDVDEDFPFD